VICRALPRVALVFLLLFSQQAALTHVSWHAHHDVGGLAHQPYGASDKPGQPSESQLCAFHLAFGQVLGGLGSDALTPAVLALEAERWVIDGRSCGYLASFPPQSRDPPVLL